MERWGFLAQCLHDHTQRAFVHVTFVLFCHPRPLPSGERQATRKWQSMRTLNSCCRLPWMMPRRSCRRVSPCPDTLTQNTVARRLGSCSPRSTRHRRTTTCMAGDRYDIGRSTWYFYDKLKMHNVYFKWKALFPSFSQIECRNPNAYQYHLQKKMSWQLRLWIHTVSKVSVKA